MCDQQLVAVGPALLAVDIMTVFIIARVKKGEVSIFYFFYYYYYYYYYFGIYCFFFGVVCRCRPMLITT